MSLVETKTRLQANERRRAEAEADRRREILLERAAREVDLRERHDHFVYYIRGGEKDRYKWFRVQKDAAEKSLIFSRLAVYIQFFSFVVRHSY